MTDKQRAKNEAKSKKRKIKWHRKNLKRHDKFCLLLEKILDWNAQNLGNAPEQVRKNVETLAGVMAKMGDI